MKVAFGRKLNIEALSNMLCGVLHTSSSLDLTLTGMCTDSREADGSTLFVALRGERVDGHDYIGAALARGCPAVIVQRADAMPADADAAMILVKDTEEALCVLAHSYLEAFPCRTVGVTGSVGKTTTKDMIASVLKESMPIYRSKGNYNSVIGMPMSVTEITEECECAILEMGMSGRGEIERMSRAAQPDIAVITNIGTSHMEMLGSRECIRDAKMEIALGLRKGGYLLLNKDEPLLRGAVGKSYRTLYVSLSCEEADFFAQNIRMENGCTYFDACWREGRLENLSLSLMGRHNVYAALYALAVGLLLDVPKDAIRRGLRAYTPEGMRQNLYRHGGITLIEDCYNASPESMRAALDVLQAAATGRRIAVLGDMLELGVTSATLHKEVGAYLAALRVERLFTVGEGGSLIAEGAVSAGMSRDCIFECPQKEDIDALCKALGSCLSFGDTVLVKASRGVKLERVIDYLKKNDQDIL